MNSVFCSDCGRDRVANPMGRCPVCGKEISQRVAGSSASLHVKHAAKGMLLPLAGGFVTLGGIAVFFMHKPLGLAMAVGGLGMVGRAAMERFMP